MTLTPPRQEQTASRPGKPSVRQKARVFFSYVFALFSTLGISLLSLSPEEDLQGERVPFAAFMLIITLSGILGGLWPALLATVLSALSIAYLFLVPREGWAISYPADRIHLGLFIAAGGLIAGASARLHGAVAQSRADRDALAVAHRELEEKVVERTSEIEALLANAPVGFSFIDRAGRYLRLNAHFSEITGAPPEAYLGKTVRDMLPALADVIEPIVQRVFATGEAVREIEVTGDSAAGAEDRRHWLSAYYPVRGASGAVISVGAVMTEITEQKRVEAALEAQLARTRQIERERELLLESERAARTEAERASRLKDDFVATVSHELRTPLNAILGWTHLLRRTENKPGQIDKGLEIIERNARLQTKLISDLLDVSRIISGKIRLEPARIDLPVMIDAALEGVRAAAEAKGITIEEKIETLDAPIWGDPGRLQQVVWNLVSNAIKFTPKQGRVTVSLKRSGAGVAIEVTDTGQGIAPEFLPYVFDRFRQAESSAARRHGGLGLGLSIVKHLVELHGGTVRAESAGPGAGARFIVELPLETRRLERGKRLDRAPALTRCDICDLSGARILVVDDEPDARGFVERVLAEAGASVITAGSALDALAILSEQQADVLLSDIGMPGMDGYELIRRIRGGSTLASQPMPAIALTAFARSEDRERALEAGFQAHLSKPVEPPELLAVVANLLAEVAERKTIAAGG